VKYFSCAVNMLLLTSAIVLAIGASAGRAQGTVTIPADDLIAARQAGMDLQYALMGSIKRATEGSFDAKLFKDAADGIVAWGKAIPGLFPVGTERGRNTRALPPIWSDRIGFEKAAAGLEAAAQGMAKATASKNQADLTSAYQATGQACSACHKTYRAR
jgi:cytochrome c556